MNLAQNIIAYYASAQVAGAVSCIVYNMLLYSTLGVYAGPIGILVGAAAGAFIAWGIYDVGDQIIDLIIELLE